MERSLLPAGSSCLAYSPNTGARLHQSPESWVGRTKPPTAAAATHPRPVLAESTPPPPTGSEERRWERTGPGIRRCNKSCIESTVQWGSVRPGPALGQAREGAAHCHLSVSERAMGTALPRELPQRKPREQGYRLRSSQAPQTPTATSLPSQNEQ